MKKRSQKNTPLPDGKSIAAAPIHSRPARRLHDFLRYRIDSHFRQYPLEERVKATVCTQLYRLREELAFQRENTSGMMKTYSRYLRGAASREEMRAANSAFRDLLGELGLGALLLLPFAPITLPLIVKLAQHFGIELLPHRLLAKIDSPCAQESHVAREAGTDGSPGPRGHP